MKLKTITINSASALTALFMMSSSVFAANHSVTIKGFSFSPASLSVTKGDTVTFKNADQAPHTATAKDGSFDTETIEAGGSKQITITNAGSFQYFCGVHPHMTAEILAQKTASLEEQKGNNKVAQETREEPQEAKQAATDTTPIDEAEVNIDEAKTLANEQAAAQITAAKRAIDKEAADKIAAANIEAYKAAAAERATAKIAAYREKMKRETYAKIKSYKPSSYMSDHNTPSCNKAKTTHSSHSY